MTVPTSWTSISDISKKTRVAFVLQKVSNCLYKDQQHQVNNFQNGNTLLDAKTITLYINRNDNALYQAGTLCNHSSLQFVAQFSYGPSFRHSRPQSPRSFWSAPRIETSGRRSRIPQQEVRESRTSGFCAQPQKFETITVTIGYKNGQLLRLRVTWTCQKSRSLRRPKGSWALGTRMSFRTKRTLFDYFRRSFKSSSIEEFQK